MPPRELPPVPESPQLSPPVLVAGEEALTLAGLPGEPSLEARVRGGPHARTSVLFCHPHPLYGGTMHSAVVVALAKVVAERGGAAAAGLRFNFRGVGASEGEYGEGPGEILDARAALRALRARAPGAEVVVCGYSFGSWVGLRAALEEGGVARVALVAPALRVFDLAEWPQGAGAPDLAIFVGDKDEFCDVREAEDLARRLGAELTVLAGQSHFFLASRRKLAEAVSPFLLGEK